MTPGRLIARVVSACERERLAGCSIPDDAGIRSVAEGWVPMALTR